jgi:hypothetical protein
MVSADSVGGGAAQLLRPMVHRELAFGTGKDQGLTKAGRGHPLPNRLHSFAAWVLLPSTLPVRNSSLKITCENLAGPGLASYRGGPTKHSRSRKFNWSPSIAGVG